MLMSIQKIYRKYGKRALASILVILLSVQTPLLSYADTNDFEISSCDDVAERPVWDDSYSVDDSNEFDSSIFELGANKISNLSNRELEPLSQNEIDYIFEHVNDSSEINMPVIDVADHDNEISTQSVVAVTASVAALILIMLAGYSSAVSANQPAGNLDYYIRSYAEDDSFNELISYIKNNVAYSVRLNAAMVKTLISKLDNCAKGNGYSLTLTDEDKQVLAYALKNRGLLTFLDPENVNVKAIDGYQYYYIYTDTKEYMKPYYVYVLYTPDSVAFAQKNTSYSSLSNQFQFYKYNALLASDFKYEPMKYYIGKYMLSSATGLYEFDSGVAYTGSGKSGIAKFGDYNYTCFPFTVTGDLSGSSKEDKFQNYFTVKSALLLDIAYCGRVVSGSALMNLENVSSTKDISEYTSMPKNFYGQVTGLNKAAGIVLSDSTTKPGAGTGTDTVTKQYSRLFYVLRALADKYKISITSAQFNEFIASFYKKYINGTSAEAPDQSKEIMDKFVVINGGKTPNDNNDDNKYDLKKRLVDGFFSFCITAGLITSAPDYSKDTNVKSNVSIDNSDDSLTGGGTNPGGGTNTGGNTSTGSSTDLSGVLEYLKNILFILGVLNAWQNPLSLIDTLVSKLGLENIVTAINNIGDNVASALGLNDLFDSLELPTYFNDLFDILNSWNFANMFSGQTNSLLTPLNNIEYGINTFWNQFIENFNSIGFKDLLTNILRIIEDLPGKLVLGFASSELFSGIGTNIANMPLYLANLLGLGTTTLPDLFNNVVESIKAIPGEIGKIIPPSSGNDNVDDGESINDSGFKNFLNLFMLTLLIIVLLIILFMNCLRFIVLVFNIPASTALMPVDMLKGIEFMKNLQLPLFGVSLYSLLLSCAYFVIFMTIIMTIRRKIDKLHI